MEWTGYRISSVSDGWQITAEATGELAQVLRISGGWLFSPDNAEHGVLVLAAERIALLPLAVAMCGDDRARRRARELALLLSARLGRVVRIVPVLATAGRLRDATVRAQLHAAALAAVA